MAPTTPDPTERRVRREPPRFRLVEVVDVEPRTARMVRVRLRGADLVDMPAAEPAASVRLLLPAPATEALVLPTWNGNEFLLADGTRPALRTFTPWRDPGSDTLAVDVVLHGEGVASGWAVRARPGLPAALSGPGRGYTVVPDASAYVLLGDESALPAMCQVLDALPDSMPTHVVVELGADSGRLALPARDARTVDWRVATAGARPGDAFVEAARALDLPDGARVWAAGEAAAVQRLRRHLFEERALPRAHTSVRGYWKVGRGGDSDTAPE
jgi:NADPH-dependent ferric siderophore reductase